MDKFKAVQASPLRNRVFNRDGTTVRQRRILVLKTGVAGIQHYIENNDEKVALESLKPGTELLLYREPNNEYDKWAVAIYRTEEDKVGYITRFKNETIARLMDEGKKFIAVVDNPETDEEARKIVDKERDKNAERAKTEDMALPISIYLIERTL